MSQGQRQTIAIPPSLLISAMGQVPDVRKCVTMDLKQPGNRALPDRHDHERIGWFALGAAARLSGRPGAASGPAGRRQTFAAIHQAIQQGLVRSCHDLSEGGLAVAVAEMAFAGGIRRRDRCISAAPHARRTGRTARTVALLFSESNTRFVCEVPRKINGHSLTLLAAAGVPCGMDRLGAGGEVPVHRDPRRIGTAAIAREAPTRHS